MEIGCRHRMTVELGVHSLKRLGKKLCLKILNSL